MLRKHFLQLLSLLGCSGGYGHVLQMHERWTPPLLDQPEQYEIFDGVIVESGVARGG